MDLPCLVAAGIGLALISAMAALRLSAVGVASARIAAALAELWIAAALWAALFSWLATLAGPAAESSRTTGWPGHLAGALWAMTAGRHLLALVALCLAAGLAAHFMWSVSRLGPRPTES